MLLTHILRLVGRRPRRALASALGAAIAAALLVTILLFGAASGATVTRRALSGVPVDAQVVLGPGADAKAQAIVTADPAVLAVLPFDLVHFDSAILNKAGSATQTSTGAIVGLAPGYPATTGLFAPSQGTAVPGQVLISRDLATNLGARPGDPVTFQLPGGGTVDLTVSGIVDITGADLVLGPLDAAHRATGGNAPTNVAVMDRASLVALVESHIAAGTLMTDPAATTGAANPVSTAETAVVRQLHLRYDHGLLPGDPVAAQTWLDQVRRRIELQGAGSFVGADDASASLTPVIGDLAWGQILFVFLGLPGILLAFVLARLSSQSGAQEIRRHVSLLRARGASARQLAVVLVGAEALIALLGAVVGAAMGSLIGLLMFGSELASISLVATIAGAWLLVVPLTTLLAVIAAAGSLRRLVNDSVASGRQELQRAGKPLWQRLYLDLLLILGALVTYFLVSASGVHPAVNTEGNPTVTLALTSFVAPLLLWFGGSLLLLRLASLLLRRSGRVANLLGRLLGPGGALAGPSLAARAAAASRLVVLVALSVSFAVSISMFQATYLQQQRVDAELTLGADLQATPVVATDATGTTAVAAAGARLVTPFAHKVVYVGAEAQDMLAIDPTTLGAVSPLADGFFVGSTAAGALAALQQTPNGVLVSSETATDYSIVPGDHLKMRVPDATGTLQEIDFQMVGVALEFPTAPRDAFLVTNIAYVAAQVADPRISFVLARTGSDPETAAVGARLGDGWQVQGLSSVTARLANGITSVDLQSLVLIDIAFALLIASVGAALFVLAGVADRAREFAALQALGAEPRQIRALLAGEVGTVGVVGLAAGLAIGLLLGVTLLTILAGIFDPPADAPSVPWATVGIVLGAAVAGLLVAYLLAGRYATRMLVLRQLRER
ncbi:MAG: ABC transporter permease [Chloroflexi bacterium]|nr:ABC transporter permease [Chloroflexota bacterium]